MNLLEFISDKVKGADQKRARMLVNICLNPHIPCEKQPESLNYIEAG
ncbi:hypothetical protein LCGC14_1716250 [marine sediment metagenome]|uniref:Uncharacterized protein n=1 Tax=marine sediment metagenome TaxID=412755 RepID=A0A0F9I1C7_9ZZZZ